MKLIVPAVLLLAAPLFARVGEKYADFESRVGKAVATNANGIATMAEHREDGRTVLPVVVDDVIVSEIREGVGPNEVAAILSKLCLGEFQPFKDDPAGPVFRSKDGICQAQYIRNAKSLIVHDILRYQAYKQKEAAQRGK